MKLGSDRIDIGNCNFLTNKLRPYLGYTILNVSALKLLGTTEFIPFEILDKKKVIPEYIRYLLLSTDYLKKSKFLMSGKEHPRIMPTDILNIQVSLPSYRVQEKIIKEIQTKELESEKARENIKKYRDQINQIITKELDRLEKE